MTGFNEAVDSKDLTYSIKLTNNQTGESKNAVINSEGTHATVTGLVVGDWDILAEVAIFENYPYGRGEIKAFPVSAGQNNATVQMERLSNAVALDIANGSKHDFGTVAVGGALDPFEITVFNYTDNKPLNVTATLTPDLGFTVTPVSVAQDGSGELLVTPIVGTAGSFNSTLTIIANGSNIANVELSLVVAYNIGDTGPGGGIIFYVDLTGFTVEGYGTAGVGSGFAPYTAYYLEVAPANANTALVTWRGSATANIIIPATTEITTFTATSDALASKIGNGRKDTQIIIAFYADTAQSTNATAVTDTAANIASDYTTTVDSVTYNDWFLPSSGELNLLYGQRNLTGIGITTGGFWSSSQGDNNSVWRQSFADGARSDVAKNSFMNVRAVRAF